MKVFVFLAVLGVCYSDITYSCKVGADFATATVKECAAVTEIAKAKCALPAYVDAPLNNDFTAYGCADACVDPNLSGGKCVHCANKLDKDSKIKASIACNDAEMDQMETYTYKCMQYVETTAGEAWGNDTKTDCNVELMKGATDEAKKAVEFCFKATEAYQKDATGNNAIKKGGCGKCVELAVITGETDAKKQAALEAGCTDNSGAAAMSFILAPLLAVLFWLH